MGTIEFLPMPIIEQTQQEPTPLVAHDVRVLTPDETRVLEPVFKAHDVDLPDPQYSFIIGAVTPDGKVTNNFLVVQLKVHAEPMHLDPGCEHLFRRIVRTAEQEISTRAGTCDVFLFVEPGSRIEIMAQVMGLTKEPWSVMHKCVLGQTPVPTPVSTPVAPAPVEDSKLEVTATEVPDVIRNEQSD